MSAVVGAAPAVVSSNVSIPAPVVQQANTDNKGITEKAKAPEEPIESFIDRGNTKLPVAPEIAEKGATKIVMPEQHMPAPASAAPTVPTTQHPDVLSKEANQAPIVPAAPKSNVALPNIAIPKLEPKQDLSLPDFSSIGGKEDNNNIPVNHAPPKAKYSITIPFPKIITDLFPKRSPTIDKDKTDKAKLAQKNDQILADKAVTKAVAPVIASQVIAPQVIVPQVVAPVAPKTAPKEVAAAPVQVVVPVIQKEPVVVTAPVAVAAPKAVAVTPVLALAPSPVIQKEQVIATPAAVALIPNEKKKVEVKKLAPPVVAHDKALSPSAEVKNIHTKAPVALLPHPNTHTNAPPKPIDPEIEKFVQNEAQMLKLPDDDVVLGSITNDAKFDYIGYSQYFSIYQKYREYVKRLNQLDATIAFIDYHRKIDGNDIPTLSDSNLFATAAQKIQYSKIDDLRALMDNYKLLNLVDRNGNSLLHIAAFEDNVAVTKWLIMRGGKVNAMNDEFTSPRDIAEHEQYWGILNLLESANAK